MNPEYAFPMAYMTLTVANAVSSFVVSKKYHTATATFGILAIIPAIDLLPVFLGYENRYMSGSGSDDTIRVTEGIISVVGNAGLLES